jgi:hypothetical protein
MRRHDIGAAVVLLAEAYLYWRYAQLHAQFHYWLHTLLGAAIGLGGLIGARLAARRRRSLDAGGRRYLLTPWEAVALGHLYAAFPDLLFLTFGLPHDYWMDAFALHITIHFIPAPVPTALALFLLALAGYGLVMSQRRRAAAAALSVAVLTVIAVVPLAASVPTDIQDLRSDPRLAHHHRPGGEPTTVPTVGHRAQEHQP